MSVASTPPARRPTPPDRSWAARATALRQEKPAQWAMLAAIASALTMLAGWVAVLVPPGGNVRFSPVYWLLALPVLPWVWGLQSQAAWAVNTVWLALALAPGLALGAVFAAPALRDPRLLEGGAAPLDTPTAMLVVLALSTAFAAAGAVALRRSSLPGGARPIAYLPPGTPPPGARPLPAAASALLMLGSLPFTGALVNGGFMAIVASLEPIGPAGAIWPGALQAMVVAALGTLLFRGAYRLARRRPGVARDLRRGWIAGMVWAAAALPALWLWPTPSTGKLAFSAFMAPLALIAAWGGRGALRALPGVLETAEAEPETPAAP